MLADKSLAEYWDDRAETVQDEKELVYNDAAHFAGCERAAHEMIAKYVREGLSVLDVGCGFGHFYQSIVNRGGTYTGVDFSAGMIGRAKKKYPDGNFLVEDLRTLPKLGTFDVVFECICASSFDNQHKYLLEIMQHYCRTDGVCIMIEPSDIRVVSTARNLFV